jgi:hypothetical protein
MDSWWKRWAERLSGSAVPVDGDPGKWRVPRRGPTGRRKPGGRRREIKLPPPAA